MNLTEIENLRDAIARVLRAEICVTNADDDESLPTAEQCRFFFKKLGGWKGEQNSKVFGYSAVRARAALGEILKAKPYWPDGIRAGANADFEKELVKYLNDKKISELGVIPAKIFRLGFDGESGSFANDEMIAGGHDAEYIVSRLFDLCGELPTGTNMLGSNRVSGIFIVAVIKVSPPLKGRLSIGSITFSDLFEPSLAFDATSIDFGDCEVKSVTRINPSSKSHMSDEDFSQYIYSIYKPSINTSEEDYLSQLKSNFLQQCVRVLAKITLKYLEPMQKLMDDSIGTGPLPRVILDVQNGVLLARQADQGRFWVLCLSPIEGMKDNSDEIFGREIMNQYEEAIRRARKRRI